MGVLQSAKVSARIKALDYVDLQRARQIWQPQTASPFFFASLSWGGETGSLSNAVNVAHCQAARSIQKTRATYTRRGGQRGGAAPHSMLT